MGMNVVVAPADYSKVGDLVVCEEGDCRLAYTQNECAASLA
jgi:hypothetical protein